jgi:predicted DNA-binding transcriptional regulator AlpA
MRDSRTRTPVLKAGFTTRLANNKETESVPLIAPPGSAETRQALEALGGRTFLFPKKNMKNRIAGLQSRPVSAPPFAGRTPLPASPADQQSQLVSAAAGVGSDLLTVHQIAAKLGSSRATVDRLTKRRLIPCIRFSRKFIRYRWRDVEKALEKITIREVA